MGKAAEKFALFEGSPDDDPVTYFGLLTAFNQELLNEQQFDKAQHIYRSSVNFYKKHLNILTTRNADNGLWNLIMVRSEIDEPDADLVELIEICEANPNRDLLALDHRYSSAATHRGVRRQALGGGHEGNDMPAVVARTIWQHVVTLRAEHFGETDIRLSSALQRLATACEKCGYLDEAEKALKMLCQLEGAHVNARWQHRIWLLQLYIRGGLIEQADDLRRTDAEFKDATAVQGIKIYLAIASAFQEKKDEEQAFENFCQALSLYQNSPEQVVRENAQNLLWLRFNEIKTEAQFDLSLFKIFEVVENRGFETWEAVDEHFFRVLSLRENFWHLDRLRIEAARVQSKRNEVQLLERLIAIRERTRENDSTSLIRLLKTLSLSAEGAMDFATAEQSLLRALTLSSAAPNVQRSSLLLSLAFLYARHEKWEPSEQYSAESLGLLNSSANENSFRPFIQLLDVYEKAGRASETEKLIRSLYARGNAFLSQTLDQKLHSLIDGATNSGNFEKAESWLKYRVQASLNIPNDPASADWRIKYSNLLLAQGRNEKSDSLFREALMIIALSNMSTDRVRQQRGELLKRLGRQSEAEAFDVAEESIESQKHFRLEYGMIATRHLEFSQNTCIEIYDPVTHERHLAHEAFKSSSGKLNICCLGSVKIGMNFASAAPIFATQEDVGLRNVLSVVQFFKLDADKVKVPPPPTGPANTMPARDIPGPLPAGDYLVPRLASNLVRFHSPAFHRIFLSEDARDSDLELDGRGSGRGQEFCRLHIIYSGNKTLRLANITAVVYAPYATVEIPMNGRFAGAIVADTIITRGNNRIYLDSTLINQDLF